MIRIVALYIPGGDEKKKEEIGTIEIVNNGTHPDRPEKGNYDVQVVHHKYIKLPTYFLKGLDTDTDLCFAEGVKDSFPIKNHVRKNGLWRLLEKILRKYNRRNITVD